MAQHSCDGHCECGYAAGDIGDHCWECDTKIVSCGGDNPFCSD